MGMRMKEGGQNSSNQQGRRMQTRQDRVEATRYVDGALGQLLIPMLDHFSWDCH